MNEMSQGLRAALAAAERLPLRLRRQLIDRLVAKAPNGAAVVAVRLQRLSSDKQARLSHLMDKSSEGRLTTAERRELRRLGAEVDQILSANSEALARALRPELFDQRGRPMKSRFRQAASAPLSRHPAAERKRAHG